MKIEKKVVEKFLDTHPHFKHRSKQYEATAEYLSLVFSDTAVITPDMIQTAITVHRRILDILPADEKSGQLEAEHLYSEGYVNKEQVRSGQVCVNGNYYKIV